VYDWCKHFRKEKEVRFILGDSESEMSTFRPGQSEPKVAKLRTAASQWTTDELDFLNVNFDYKAEYAFSGLERIPIDPQFNQSNRHLASFSNYRNYASLP